ncbi:MAG: hypothetical protein KBD07_02020 [Candidatus Omnitrophica bacterium]|jgi:hypothetical protein|nr:hypothetical protein [Candidatus Omnitrophota bacterium]
MFDQIRKKIGFFLFVVLALACLAVFLKFKEHSDFKKVITALEADSRAAQVLVTESSLDETTGKFTTTIKFLEHNYKGEPMAPRYFTFKGNQIQFQALVVRFEDGYIERGHRLKGKSAFLFLKAFVLDGKNTQEFVITPALAVPEGYRVEGAPSKMQKEIWTHFWTYVLDPKARKGVGVKNAQIEAPGSVFVPGTIYDIRIEHDGGLRIDAKPIPAVLRGETIQ